MDGINQIDELYTLLKERKSDYVIWGEVVERLIYLQSFCSKEQDKFYWYLGGPIYWIMNWRATKKADQRLGISKTERNIIRILDTYEFTFKNDYVALVDKNINRDII